MEEIKINIIPFMSCKECIDLLNTYNRKDRQEFLQRRAKIERCRLCDKMKEYRASGKK